MNLKICEIVQQLEYLNHDIIKTVLDTNKAIQDYAYILHDKDTIGSTDELKKPHFHIYLRFKYACDTKHIAQWFNIGEQYVNKIKGKFSDALSYAIHENAPDKYQYSVDEVISNYEWQVEKKGKSDKILNKELKQSLIESIVNGTVRKFNIQIIPAEYYIKWNRDIKLAFEYRTRLLMSEMENRDMKVYFIQGESGSGKTTLAKQLAKQENYSYYVSGGSNDALDGYEGQDCLILDDLRSSTLGLSDLLKILDNHTGSLAKSRYYNKVLECKMIIITTVMDMETFFYNVFKDEEEPIKQLQRRCQNKIVMTKDNLKAYVYDDIHDKYVLTIDMPNTITDNYHKKTIEEKQTLIKKTFKGLIKNLDDYVDNNY